MTQLELHGQRAALRGNPSFVWRAGQDRRLSMIVQHGLPAEPAPVERILVDGCGVGAYVKALQPFAREVWGIDIEPEHLTLAQEQVPSAEIQQAMCEQLPYPDGTFDLVLSHEVLEHVQDDRLAAAEMVRVLKKGRRAVIFAPNRWFPFETHGHYWRGDYHFGNTPLINYLPDIIRDRLAPHVRTYTRRGLLSLFVGLPVRVRSAAYIMPGYDKLVVRKPALGRIIRFSTYAMERAGLAGFGISHLLVVEKV